MPADDRKRRKYRSGPAVYRFHAGAGSRPGSSDSKLRKNNGHFKNADILLKKKPPIGRPPPRVSTRGSVRADHRIGTPLVACPGVIGDVVEAAALLPPEGAADEHPGDWRDVPQFDR